MHEKALTFRLIGFVVSLLLTLSAYLIIAHPDFFHFEIQTATIAILALAVLQFMVQFIFFINLWREKGPPWNMVVFVSTVSIVLIVVIGSLWIMHHLNYHMMPQMQTH